MITKMTIVGLALALMGLSVPLAYAHNGPTDMMGRHQGQWHHQDKKKMMAEVLNLTPDQQKQLETLHQQQKEKMKTTFEQIKSNRAAFEAEIAKAAPDMNKVNDLQAKLKAIQAQRLDEHLNSLLAVKKVLTPEQFAGFMALTKQRHLMMMRRMHGRFEHRDQAAGHAVIGDKGQPDVIHAQ